MSDRWRLHRLAGEYGEHKVPQTTDPAPTRGPAPAHRPRTGPGDCTRDGADFRNGGFGEYSRDLSCQEMLNQWDAFLADTLDGPDAGERVALFSTFRGRRTAAAPTGTKE